jgi:hypothetical protein
MNAFQRAIMSKRYAPVVDSDEEEEKSDGSFDDEFDD